MNNSFIILLFSVILLNRVEAADEDLSLALKNECALTALTETERTDIFAGAKLVELCMEESKNLLGRVKSKQGLQQSSNELIDRLTWDLFIYKKVNELAENLLRTQDIEHKKEMADYIAIISAAHFCLPYPAGIEKRLKSEIKEKFGTAKSLSADYFINCLTFSPGTKKFTLSQFPPIEGSQLALFQELAIQLSQDSKAYSTAEVQEISEIGKILIETAPLLEKHNWDQDAFFEDFGITAQTYKELTPTFSRIQDLLALFNEKMCAKKSSPAQDRTEDRSALEKAFTDFAIELRKPAPETIRLTGFSHIKNLIQNRLEMYARTHELLNSRMYTDAEKLLLIPAIGKPGSNVLSLARSTNKQAEVYQLAKEQLEQYFIHKSQTPKRRIPKQQTQESKEIDNLYLLLAMHSKALMIENPAEIDYIKPIITFISDSVSQKAKDFSECMHVCYYEDEKDNVEVTQKEVNDKDILYFFRHSPLSIEPTRTYMVLLGNIEGLSLEQPDKINRSKELATELTEAFETEINGKMKAAHAHISSQDALSHFRKIYLSLIYSFYEASPILIEYQNYISKLTNKITKILQKEPNYVAMQKELERKMIEDIEGKNDEDKPKKANKTKKKKNREKKSLFTKESTEIDTDVALTSNLLTKSLTAKSEDKKSYNGASSKVAAAEKIDESIIAVHDSMASSLDDGEWITTERKRPSKKERQAKRAEEERLKAAQVKKDKIAKSAEEERCAAELERKAEEERQAKLAEEEERRAEIAAELARKAEDERQAKQAEEERARAAQAEQDEIEKRAEEERAKAAQAKQDEIEKRAEEERAKAAQAKQDEIEKRAEEERAKAAQAKQDEIEKRAEEERAKAATIIAKRHEPIKPAEPERIFPAIMVKNMPGDYAPLHPTYYDKDGNPYYPCQLIDQNYVVAYQNYWLAQQHMQYEQHMQHQQHRQYKAGKRSNKKS